MRGCRVSRYYSDEFKLRIVKLLQDDKSISAVAREHKLSKSTVSAWQQQYKNSGIFNATANLTDAEKELRECRKEQAQSALENDLAAYIDSDTETKLSIICDLAYKHNVCNMCKYLSISRSTYYYSPTDTTSRTLENAVLGVVKANNNYGTRKIKKILSAQSNITASRKRISKVIKKFGSKDNMLRHVALFSGGGGFSLGIERAGFTTVYADDFDPDAREIYKLNFGFEPDGRDICTVPAGEIPDCDIITAGPPCQPFSSIGNRGGISDPRGTLYLECIRIIEAKTPKIILLENVVGLLRAKDDAGNLLIDLIVADLKRIGYNVHYDIYDASNFSVPQQRKRLIIVGIRLDLNKTFTPPPVQSKVGLTLSSVLRIPRTVPNQVGAPLSPIATGLIPHIPEGGSAGSVHYNKLPTRFQAMKASGKYSLTGFYRRSGRGEIAKTVTATGHPDFSASTHPIQHRRYNVRETARMQSFPDDFLFLTDTRRDIIASYKVIGNAIPCNLAYAFAKAIKEQVFIGNRYNNYNM
jgi:DNA (cytosine-5)-methyltransferase 1